MAYKNIKNIIINNAFNLFVEKGYNNVSVNEICSVCSITKPTLYYHFKSKEDIIYSYFDNAVKEYEISENTLELLKQADGRSCVLMILSEIFKVYTHKGYDLTQAFISCCLADISKDIVFPKKIQDKIITKIEQGKSDGSIENTADADCIYKGLFHCFMGYLLYWSQHNGLIGEEHSMETELESIFR